MTFLRLLDQLVVPFLLIFLFIGSVGGIALGGALLLRAAAAIGFIRSMNRYVSTRKATREISIPRPGFRQSRWLGGLLVLGGAFAGTILLAKLLTPRAAVSVADPRFLTALAIETTGWLFVAGCLLSLAMGVLMLFSPRVLDALEAQLNRWVSTRNLVPLGGDQMRTPLDVLVEVYPRAAGWIILVASLIVAVAICSLIAVRWLR